MTGPARERPEQGATPSREGPSPITPPLRLYVISDRRRMGVDPTAAVVVLARAGLRAFQWREKDLTPEENLAALRSLIAGLQGSGTAGGFHLLVNDRADLALAAGTGLHLTETSIPTRDARRILPSGAILGRSTHSVEGARLAEAGGADFVTFGPVYDTPSKRSYGPPAGIDALQAAASACKIPVIALGGITASRVAECRTAGAAGVAVIGAVWDDPDPASAVDRLLSALARS